MKNASAIATWRGRSWLACPHDGPLVRAALVWRGRLAFGGRDWLELADDGGPEAVSFAFASIVRGRDEVYTMGMQVMGFPNLLMRSRDIDDRGETVIEIIRYICGGGRPIGVGHVLADDQGRPRFQVVAKTDDEFEAQSPMHNPFGVLKIVSAKDIAEEN